VHPTSFFSVAKLGWLIVQPSHLLLWLALATAAALLAGRQRLGRGLAAAAALLFLAFAVLPVGDALARALENQYPRPAPPPAHVDGILSLGGGLGTDNAVSETRIVSTFELARLYPNARVVFSGGWGATADAFAAKYILARQLGLDPARLTLEPDSRDTYENFIDSQRIVHPKPGEVWILATSALHLPRAMAVSRQVGWPMIPWATDYQTTPRLRWRGLHDYFDIPANLLTTDDAVHEWIGLLAYGADGRTKPR
jgi:uncharacterized SAM-binding protein YcdF (DUF218 family)